MIACQVLVQIYSTKEFGSQTVCAGLCCVHTDVYRIPSFSFLSLLNLLSLICLHGHFGLSLTHDITSFLHCSFVSAQHFCCWLFSLVYALHCSALADVPSSVRSFLFLVFSNFLFVVHQRSDSFVVCG